MTASRRRGHGDGSVYLGTGGRWRGAVTTGTDASGRRLRKYFSGSTEAEVRRKVRAAVAAVERGELTGATSPRLAEWLAFWLEHVVSNRNRPTTAARYEVVVRRWIVPALGARRLDLLTTQDVHRLYAAIRAQGKLSTARQVHAVLRRALRVAEQEGRVSRNVAALVDAPTYRAPEVQPLTEAEAVAVLRAAQGTAMPARWSLALILGLRQGEALGLCWSDVDLDAGVLRVRRQLQARRSRHACGEPRTVQGRRVYPCGRQQAALCRSIPAAERRRGRLRLVAVKSRRSRRALPLPEPLLDQLREHRDRQEAAAIERAAWGYRRGWETEADGRGVVADLVFTGPLGGPVDPKADWQAWHALLEEAGVPRARLHDARHTAATLMLVMGVQLKVVSEILGHSSASFTADTYVHLTPPQTQDATAAMSARLLRSAGPVLDPVLVGVAGS